MASAGGSFGSTSYNTLRAACQQPTLSVFPGEKKGERGRKSMLRLGFPKTKTWGSARPSEMRTFWFCLVPDGCFFIEFLSCSKVVIVYLARLAEPDWVLLLSVP
jgi:hypothetical protein